MKKKIAIILAIILVLSLCIVFCSCDNIDGTKLKTDNEVINEKYAFVSGLQKYDFVYDRETKQCYLMIRKDYDTKNNETLYAFIPLYDENGKPLLYQGEIE